MKCLHTQSIDECRVCDEDISAISFRRDAIIAIDDRHMIEVNIVAIYRVHAIGVPSWASTVGCAININILHQDVLAFEDGHRPHLALHKFQPGENRVTSVPDRESMRSVRII